MSLDSQKVNNLLQASKFLVEKNLSSNNYPEQFKQIQTLAFAGMLCFYGTKHFSKIYRAFFDPKFYYTDEDVFDVLRNNTDMHFSRILSLAYMNTPAFVYRKFDVESSFKDNKVFIFFNKFDSIFQQYEAIIHEDNHLVNSVEKSTSKKLNFNGLRYGLSYSYYNKNKSFEEGCYLEEVINNLQTENIINIILSFAEYDIKDVKLKEQLDLLSVYSKNCKVRGYTGLLSLVRPLYECLEFNTVVKDSRLSGNTDDIEKHFDQNLYEGAYEALIKSMDTDSKDARVLINKYVTKRQLNN